MKLSANWQELLFVVFFSLYIPCTSMAVWITKEKHELVSLCFQFLCSLPGKKAETLGCIFTDVPNFLMVYALSVKFVSFCF